MGKRRRTWNKDRYLLDLKNGVSQGSGADYIPGISVHDFPSLGVVARVPGRKTGRIHHLLSHWEEYYFYLLDTDPDVLDIQEQFWLRLSETLDTASRFNIRHPRQGTFFSPLSTDFLVFRRNGIQARTIKETRELNNPRVLEKFSIEYQYWKERGIDWKVVTEKEINLVRSRNLQWLYAPPTAAEAVPDEALRNEALDLFMELLEEKQFSFSAIVEIVEDALSLKHGSAISLFKELVLSGRLYLDLDRPLNFMDPLAKEWACRWNRQFAKKQAPTKHRCRKTKLLVKGGLIAMDFSILINQVVHSVEEDRDYRVLWNDNPGYWICLNGNENMPKEFSMEKLQEDLQSGLFTLVPDLWMTTPGFQEPSASSIQRRDRIWALIGDIVTREPAVFDPVQRKVMLQEKSELTGIAIPNFYPHLGRYWRGGKVPDALLGKYQICGKCRDPYKENATRLGRKKKKGAAGKTLTVKDLQFFQDAITRHHLNGDKLSLEKTYRRLLGDHYTVKDKAGKSVAQMSPDDIPSRAQFFYWYRTNKDILEEAKSQNGEKSYNLNNRAELGRTETHIYGPGMASQIDATTADIYLVSRDDRSAIIGRPTMYFLMDSHSHIVTGMNISLDPPSWDNAAKTILNAIENKVDFCKRYGVNITEEEWPCQNIPSVILGDRGEMESKLSDSLVKHLGITIENAPPYRADLKGIIEKHFDLINIDMASLPGKVKKDFGERCTEDYRLNATLDIFQFTAIIIRCVLQYNNYHYMKEYRKTPQMRQLHVKPIPRDLWNYGIRYMSGGLRAMNREYVRYHLLPKGEASITKRGISFNKQLGLSAPMFCRCLLF